VECGKHGCRLRQAQEEAHLQDEYGRPEKEASQKVSEGTVANLLDEQTMARRRALP